MRCHICRRNRALSCDWPNRLRDLKSSVAYKNSTLRLAKIWENTQGAWSSPCLLCWYSIRGRSCSYLKSQLCLGLTLHCIRPCKVNWTLGATNGMSTLWSKEKLTYQKLAVTDALKHVTVYCFLTSEYSWQFWALCQVYIESALSVMGKQCLVGPRYLFFISIETCIPVDTESCSVLDRLAWRHPQRLEMIDT